jgi:hypothetical protein
MVRDGSVVVRSSAATRTLRPECVVRGWTCLPQKAVAPINATSNPTFGTKSANCGHLTFCIKGMIALL